MINLKDVTFMIPFKYDSPERLRNLRIVIKYIKKYFDTNIIVCEGDTERKFTDEGDFKYIFVNTGTHLLLRTKSLNIMAKEAKTPIIVNYDTDVVLNVNQYEYAAKLIRENTLEFVYPYNGKFMNLVEPFISQIEKNVSLDGITEANGACFHPNSVGGALFMNREKFIEYGMENQNFISWGFEDDERKCRFLKLGAKMGRVEGCLFHLNHPASANSANTQHKAYYDNQFEFNKVNNMNPQQLKEYINTWEWAKK